MCFFLFSFTSFRFLRNPFEADFVFSLAWCVVCDGMQLQINRVIVFFLFSFFCYIRLRAFYYLSRNFLLAFLGSFIAMLLFLWFFFLSFHIFGMRFLFVCCNTHQIDKQSHRHNENADHTKITIDFIAINEFTLTNTHSRTLFERWWNCFGFIFVSKNKYQHQNFIMIKRIHSTNRMVRFYVLIFKKFQPFKRVSPIRG